MHGWRLTACDAEYTTPKLLQHSAAICLLETTKTLWVRVGGEHSLIEMTPGLLAQHLLITKVERASAVPASVHGVDVSGPGPGAAGSRLRPRSARAGRRRRPCT